jgi:hypothetical protein
MFHSNWLWFYFLQGSVNLFPEVKAISNNPCPPAFAIQYCQPVNYSNFLCVCKIWFKGKVVTQLVTINKDRRPKVNFNNFIIVLINWLSLFQFNIQFSVFNFSRTMYANVIPLWDGWKFVTAQFSATKSWCETVIPLNSS